MIVNINLPAHIESKLRRLAAAAGQDVGVYALQMILKKLAQEDGRELAKAAEMQPQMGNAHGNL